MGAYILRRLLLMIPTLFGIMAISFIVIQFAPGGPVEQVIANITGQGGGAADRIGGGSSDFQNFDTGGESSYRGAQGLDPEFIAQLERQFGFDKPPLERFANMIWNYARFDFGDSYFRDISVIDLIIEKMPVSISLGLWITLISYAISIPLGIRKAVKDGSSFDVWTSGIVIVAYAIPGFLFAILLMVLFAGGSFFDWFPLRGLTSENWSDLSWPERILEEIRKQYVVTARAKGLSERQVLYRHVFRNAMLIIIAGFPGAFISAFFTGSLLIENIFSLDGLGLLGFRSVLDRDYPVVFATLYIFSLIGLLVSLLSDLMYTWIDPRIDFERRDV